MLVETPERVRRLVTARRVAVVLFVASAGAFAVAKLAVSPSHFVDLRVYRLEGAAVRDGQNLYGPLPGIDLLATYPPFAAVAFVPLTFLPLGVLEAAVMLASLAVLAWVCVATARWCGASDAVTAGLVFAAAAVWSEPVAWTLHYGQINLLLLALVLHDVTRPAGSRTTGLGIGLAAALKVTPGIFIVYLLLTRRVAAAARAAGVFAVTLLVSLAVDARGTFRFWTDYLFDVTRVGRVENAANQSVTGWLVRLRGSRDVPFAGHLLVAVVAVAGLAVAVVAYRRLGDRWGVPACAVTGLLVSPIAWDHHWVWCVPIVVLLWFEARAWAVLAIIVFWSYAVWRIPHSTGAELHLSTVQALASAVYVVFGLLFLGLTVVRARRHRRTPADILG